MSPRRVPQSLSRGGAGLAEDRSARWTHTWLTTSVRAQHHRREAFPAVGSVPEHLEEGVQNKVTVAPTKVLYKQ